MKTLNDLLIKWDIEIYIAVLVFILAMADFGG